jgi:hypothetical protein
MHHDLGRAFGHCQSSIYLGDCGPGTFFPHLTTKMPSPFREFLDWLRNVDPAPAQAWGANWAKHTAISYTGAKLVRAALIATLLTLVFITVPWGKSLANVLVVSAFWAIVFVVTLVQNLFNALCALLITILLAVWCASQPNCELIWGGNLYMLKFLAVWILLILCVPRLAR